MKRVKRQSRALRGGTHKKGLPAPSLNDWRVSTSYSAGTGRGKTLLQTECLCLPQTRMLMF